MAKTLANIQKGVRFITKDDGVILTIGFGQVMFNSIYRSLCAMFDWPELIKEYTITSQTTTTTGVYEWTATSFPVYLDLKYVSVLSDSYDSPTTSTDILGVSSVAEATARTTYKNVYPPPNEYEWDIQGRMAAIDQPKYFKRYYDASGSRHVIELRPAPSTAGYNIKAVGKVEPTELSTPSGTTVFLQSSADDALEHLLAAAYYFSGNDNAKGEIELKLAADRLSTIFVAERITTEDLKRVIP